MLTVYSYTLLAIAGKRTGLRSYEKVVRVTMGAGMDYFLAFCMWFLSFGTEVSYVISMGDITATFIENAPNVPHFFTTKTAHRLITALLWLCFMYPLTLPREINSLRYFSVIAIFLMMYFVFSMVLHSFQNGLRHGVREDIVYFQTSNSAVQGLAIFMAAYLSQLNCYEVYDELYKPTVRRLTMTGGISVTLCFSLYSLAGSLATSTSAPR
ncbi:unnamed protein product [Phytomonas sp. EM1]|nr:unnamed protein product [Phytomonas sp. EM1]|eukprot:CCW65414.1 unnamed protein product [Phytomonas sp. isolate EM1]